MLATFAIYGIIAYAAIGSLAFWGLAYRSHVRDTAPRAVRPTRPAVAVSGGQPAYRKAA